MSLDYFSTITDNSKAYRLIYNIVPADIREKIEKSSILTNLKNRLAKVIRDTPENSSEITTIKSEIRHLLDNPEHIDQILFIFVGTVDNSDVAQVLSTIEENKSFSNISYDLDGYFGYDVRREWDISEKFSKIFFIDKLIHQEDSINFLYLFISSLITKYTSEGILDINIPIISDLNSILLYSNSANDRELRKSIIKRNIRKY